MRHFAPRRLAALVLTAGFASPVLAQTTHTVTLSGFAFSPANLTIQEGDTVQWDWVSGFHNVESGTGGVHDGIFRSGDPVFPPMSFSLTFDSAFLAANPVPGNVYDYFCSVHQIFGMEGSITVMPAAAVPALPLWGLAVSAAGVAGAAGWLLRRRHVGASTPTST